jgi:phenylalanyl-tRNA synthetase alpha chain
MQNTIEISSEEDKELIQELKNKDDAEAKRQVRFLSMKDLSRTEGSPIAEIVNRLCALPRYKNFEVMKVPEIVRVNLSFDMFNFPEDHPARSKSDTYYVNDEHILRPHTTVMWHYHLAEESVKEKINARKPVGAISYGKVYRKDEIDRHHMNVFHQIDGWYLAPKELETITAETLKDVLIEIAQAIFGSGINYRFNKDTFPYTNPSLEMEIEVEGRWIEVLGSGIVHPKVLQNFGVDPDVYNGWAFGFGLERLAIISMDLPDIRLLWSNDERVTRQLKLGQKYVPVSKFPPITRDISFIVTDDFVPNNYFDLIRDLGGELVEEVQLLDKYENEEKFGKGKVSYTYHIIYRSNERTLISEEVDIIQNKLYKETAKQYSAELR